jgi:galactokinase/mevalonate kinase-like predicted kinase
MLVAVAAERGLSTFDTGAEVQAVTEVPPGSGVGSTATAMIWL